MISSHVEDIIVAIKANPNGLWRNKALSHAHDLLASLNMMELGILPTDRNRGLTRPYNAEKEVLGAFMNLGSVDSRCICPPDSVRFNCPVHSVV